jgi:hypothetical protein
MSTFLIVDETGNLIIEENTKGAEFFGSLDRIARAQIIVEVYASDIDEQINVIKCRGTLEDRR